VTVSYLALFFAGLATGILIEKVLHWLVERQNR